MGDGTKIEWAEAFLFGEPLPKRCSKCKRMLPVGEFPRDRTRHEGLSFVCWRCQYRRQGGSQHPGARERRQKIAAGLRWCRGCAAWLPLSAVLTQGMCRPCANAADRNRYATRPSYRAERRQHAHARKRGALPLPLVGQENLLEQFEGTCAYCPSPATTWDHVVAITAGGDTTPGNVVPACSRCNSSKRNRPVWDWLEATGRTPHAAFLDVIALVGGIE